MADAIKDEVKPDAAAVAAEAAKGVNIEEPTDEDDGDVITPVATDKASAEAPAGGEKGKDQPLPEALIDRAAKVGLTDADLAEFKEPGELERALKFLERGNKALGVEAKPPAEKAAEEAAAATAAAEKAKAEEPDPAEVTLDEAVFDPDIIKAFKGQSEQIKALRAEVKALTGDRQMQSAVAAEERFDGLVDALEAKELFGEGRGVKMDRKSTEFQNRAALYHEMAAIKVGYQQTGRPEPTEAELFAKALRSAFPAVETAKTANALKKRSGQTVSRVASRAGKDGQDLTPEQKAKVNVAKMLKDRDIDLSGSGSDE